MACVPLPWLETILRESAALRGERADLINELALKGDALHLAEDEVDTLRHALGHTEVPL